VTSSHCALDPDESRTGHFFKLFELAHLDLKVMFDFDTSRTLISYEAESDAAFCPSGRLKAVVSPDIGDYTWSNCQFTVLLVDSQGKHSC
jgi:hypothetical protein